MITVKRFNPDAAMSISREHAWMRETPEGGHVEYGDYATLFAQFETVKAERDAQQKRADELAVENAALKSRSIKLFNLGYLRGHESTVEGYFVDVHWCDIDTYHDDVVAEIIEDEDETPATDAALAAIEARAKVEAIELLIGRKKRELADMHPDTHAFGMTSALIRNQIRCLESFATELREAK